MDAVANPWLSIPLPDYEGHMSAAGVEQLAALSELFGQVLREVRPESVVVLGVAGGNGLERIDPSITSRTAGVDIHPDYLEASRRRFPSLECHLCDLAREPLEVAPFALVHAALILEHAGTGQCLENAVRLVRPGGALSVVLQLPGSATEGVAATPFASIQRLRDHFQYVEPETLLRLLGSRGFDLARQWQTPLPGGKAFWTAIFRQKL